MGFEQQMSSNPLEGEEKLVGTLNRGPERSSNFEGKQIFTFYKNGTPIKYSLSKDAQNNLEGSSFIVVRKNDSEARDERTPDYAEKTDITLGPVYQLNQQELNAISKILESKGIQI